MTVAVFRSFPCPVCPPESLYAAPYFPSIRLTRKPKRKETRAETQQYDFRVHSHQPSQPLFGTLVWYSKRELTLPILAQAILLTELSTPKSAQKVTS